MDDKKIIIGLCGKKQCGKDTSYQFIREILWKDQPIFPPSTVQRFAFADKLKDITADLFGVDRNKLDGSDAEKDSPTHIKWYNVAPHLQTDFFGPFVYYQDMTEYVTHRELLQLFGTNACRAIHPDVWPYVTTRSIEKSNAKVAVITDVRFPNEIEALREIGSIIVKIYRQTNSNLATNHTSETALDHIPDKEYDFIISDEGNRTMEDLKQSWRLILGQILKN